MAWITKNSGGMKIETRQEPYLTPAMKDSLTRTIPLDRPRYERCLRSGEMRPLVEADIERATRIGVGSTPSFLVGGRPLIGAQPYEAFKQAIDAALAAAPPR